MMKGTGVKVEYDSTPIRHMAIECPNCENWFKRSDITDEDIYYEYQINGTQCHCPKCEEDFEIDIYSKDSKIDTNVNFPEFYDYCLRRKTTWE